MGKRKGNKIEYMNDGTCHVWYNSLKCKNTGYFIIDEDSVEAIQNYTWRYEVLDNRQLILGKINGELISLSAYLLHMDKHKYYTKFLNGNRLDYRLKNIYAEKYVSDYTMHIRARPKCKNEYALIFDISENYHNIFSSIYLDEVIYACMVYNVIKENYEKVEELYKLTKYIPVERRDYIREITIQKLTDAGLAV